MAQLMPLPPAVSCFRKVQIGFTFLVPAHLGSPRQRAIKLVLLLSLLISEEVSLTEPKFPYWREENARRCCDYSIRYVTRIRNNSQSL